MFDWRWASTARLRSISLSTATVSGAVIMSTSSTAMAEVVAMLVLMTSAVSSAVLGGLSDGTSTPGDTLMLARTGAKIGAASSPALEEHRRFFL